MIAKIGHRSRSGLGGARLKFVKHALVRFDGNEQFLRASQVFVFPKVSYRVGSLPEPKILPTITKFPFRFSTVKYCKIVTVPGSGFRHPDSAVIRRTDHMIPGGMLIDGENFAIGK